MIIVAGKTYVAGEKREAYLSSFEDFIRRTREEPGCLDMIIAADPIEADRVNVFELWASKAQLDNFRNRAEPPAPVTEILVDEVVQYEISSSGPPFPE